MFSPISRVVFKFNKLVQSQSFGIRVRLLHDVNKPVELPFVERTTEVLTCKHLFNRKDNPGLRFHITYIDEQNEVQKQIKKPIVVMLHGAPGSYMDLQKQVKFMVAQGARVLVPNFPDLPSMLKHRSPKFHNSPENKAALVRDFLHLFGIHEIDMLVAHSSASYPAMKLLTDSDTLRVNSMALLNPACPSSTIMSPRWMYEAMDYLTYNRAAYAIMRIFNKPLVKYFSTIIRCTDVNEPLMSITALIHFSKQEALNMIKKVADHKSPFLHVFSEDDKLNRKEVCYELLELFGGDRNDISLIDSAGKYVTKGSGKHSVDAVCFKNGSHYSFIRYPDVVNQSLLMLLRKSMGQ